MAATGSPLAKSASTLARLKPSLSTKGSAEDRRQYRPYPYRRGSEACPSSAAGGLQNELRYRHHNHHVAHLRDGVGPEQREDRVAIRGGRPLLRHRPYLALFLGQGA